MKANKWDMNDIADQNGRVAIVTGSSSGIGFEAARVLALKNATVIVAVRNLTKGKTAVDKILNESKSADVKAMQLDLADLNSVRGFANEFTQQYDRLDLLINNAGVMVPPHNKTRDGFELQMGTNHVGHFALTGLLIDLILQTPGSRIVNVSSAAHAWGNIDFEDLQWEKRKYKKWQAYGDSKIANLYFTYALQEKLGNGSTDIIVAAAHPGWTATELQRNTSLVSFLNNFFGQKIDMGALPTLYAATAPDVEKGGYYGPGGFKEMKGYPKKVSSIPLSHDREIREKLWTVSEELTGVTYPKL
jgi:NAD(P)-dependent dehydrogenase (short-subunit alcohol dehydrogenase family)